VVFVGLRVRVNKRRVSIPTSVRFAR